MEWVVIGSLILKQKIMSKSLLRLHDHDTFGSI